MATRIKLRRDTAANWLEQNPILAQGETGFETDTRTMKLGDGATRWADLKYAVTGDLKVTDDTIHGDASVSLSSGIGNRENWILSVDGNDGSPENPGDTFNDGVAYDSLGNAYSIGWYDNISGLYLQKISPSGEVLFSNFYNQYDSYGYGLTVDKNNDVVMILGEQDGSDGGEDIVLVKVSGDDGTIHWQKNINGYGDTDEYATCIDVDLNGDIFIVGGMSGDGDDCYIGKFSGVNGNALWQKRYDVEGLDNSGTGVTVDKDGNLAVVGSVSWMAGFITLFKISGNDGSLIWESRVGIVVWNNGNENNGYLSSTDVAADSNGDFYFGMNAAEGAPQSAGLLVKFDGSTGAKVWARRIGWDDWLAGTGSVITDDQDNVYVSTTMRKDKNNYDTDSSYRATQQITKFNSTGTVIWQRWLSAEQAETKGDSAWAPFGGQNIRVNDKYVLVGGNYDAQYSYNEDSNSWYTRPYVAQLNRDGGEFEVSGWSFKASNLPVEFVTLDEQNFDTTFDPANVNDANTDVTNGDVNTETSTDLTTLVYINKSNVNKLTFSEKTLTLPAGGSVDISRERLGYITAIGSFDGSEGIAGSNGEGGVWLNGSARDDAGNTYSAGGWYNVYNTWNNWDTWENIPLVFKTDSTGKLVWQAGNALDQYGVDLVDVAYHADTNTVVVVGNDGSADGNEGFNVSYLDADTGGMKQDITHIRPTDAESDIYPQSLRITSNGTPVVAGYVDNAEDTFANVTLGAAGLTGSTNDGRLVVPLSTFVVEGKTTEYPSNDGNWYVYPAGAYVSEVNSYGSSDAQPAITYTGTPGSGATFDINITSGIPSAVIVNQAGSGYKVGQRIVTAGTNLGGVSSDNDLSLFVGEVDGSGGIVAINNYQWTTSAPADGAFTGVVFTSQTGSGIGGWVSYAPAGTEYTFNKTDNGMYYGIGDTFKILGNVLGGATPANDLTITVTSTTGTGYMSSGVNEFTVAGTPQTANIKLYAGSADYTIAGTYDITHELNAEGFIWTPDWAIEFGSNVSGSYDEVFGITLDSSDNVIAGGRASNMNIPDASWGNTQTGYVAKFDAATGEQLWAVSVDGMEGYSDVWSVAVDANDNVYSAMTDTNDDLVITKLTSDGEFVWQESFQLDNSESFSMEVTPEGDILVVGEVYHNDFFDNNYHQDNWNLLLLKLDKDGNVLFTRTIWSQNGLYFNNNDTYSNQLTVKGDRFSISAHSNDPGDESYQGIVIDLPLDGTGIGDYGNFHYEEVELYVNNRRTTNNNPDTDNPIVTPVTLPTRPHTFLDVPYEGDDAWRNTTVYADRSHQIQTIYKPAGGSITGVAKIVFEDGSEQHTSMQGLPQVELTQVNGGYNDYWLRPEDNGKHILQLNDQTVIIPNPNRVELPVGFAFTIINKGNNSGVWCEGYDDTIYLSGDGGNSDASYEIPSWTMATLVKIADGQWMIAGAGLSSGWW